MNGKQSNWRINARGTSAPGSYIDKDEWISRVAEGSTQEDSQLQDQLQKKDEWTASRVAEESLQKDPQLQDHIQTRMNGWQAQ